PSSVYQSMLDNQSHQKDYYDKHSVKERCFYPKERVRIQDPQSKLWGIGIVLESLSEPRSYLVQYDNGKRVRKNTIHLRKDTRFVGKSLDDTPSK
ncbi:hypothetical protein SGI37_20215, partial [Providencia rettgeri]